MSIENGRWTGPIWDTHMHLDTNGRGVDAAQDFANAGGTHLCLVHKPGMPGDIAAVRTDYEATLKMAESVRSQVGLDVRVILGPHPVIWEKQVHTLGMEDATDLHLDSCRLALDLIAEGKAVALGEVGRPHYPVADEIWDAANLQLREVMHMAAQANVPIQLHVEDNGAETNAELAAICSAAGLEKHTAVHHYAQADVSAAFTQGLSASVSMGKNSIETILETFQQSSATWTMATDFLDDPRRPGAVLGPKTVPKRTQALVEALEVEQAVDLLHLVHRVWPGTLYGEFDP